MTELDRPRSVLDLIRGIQAGSIEPTTLAGEDRRLCVGHLSSEGYSSPEIAQILNVSDRTIERDRAAIRKSMSLARDPGLADRFAGQLLAAAELGISRIRRVSRDRDASPGTKIDAERVCWTITKELIDRLQSLGYLPTAAAEIRGEMTHHVEQLPAFSTMREEVDRIAVIVTDLGRNQLMAELEGVRELVDRGAAQERLRALTMRISETIDDSDNGHVE